MEREQRFWTLTKDDIDPWVRQRAERLLTRTNPSARLDAPERSSGSG